MIAAFVRAIRAGAIDIQQSTVVLAHYGRFGPFFDQCARFLGDTLKNEGVYGDRADTVASVSFQSLRDVSSARAICFKTTLTYPFRCEVHRVVDRWSSQKRRAGRLSFTVALVLRRRSWSTAVHHQDIAVQVLRPDSQVRRRLGSEESCSF